METVEGLANACPFEKNLFCAFVFCGAFDLWERLDGFCHAWHAAFSWRALFFVVSTFGIVGFVIFLFSCRYRFSISFYY
jgi:hypothetical protein